MSTHGNKLKIPDHQHYNQSKLNDCNGLISSNKAKKGSNRMVNGNKAGMKKKRETKRKVVMFNVLNDCMMNFASVAAVYLFRLFSFTVRIISYKKLCKLFRT